jgi:hypothetical protein
MVQLSKKTFEDKQQEAKEAVNNSKLVLNNTNNSHHRQLEEFHSPLLNSSAAAVNSNKLNRNNSNSSHRSAEKSAPQLEISADGQLRVVTAPSYQEEFTTAVESSSHGKARRMPASSRDFGGAPPEKRLKLSTPERGLQAASSSSSGRRSSKGGKGIRNRVFCGDCPGCLKNDDCGQCRYCRYTVTFNFACFLGLQAHEYFNLSSINQSTL